MRKLLQTEESASASILRWEGTWPEWRESREPRREEENEDRNIPYTTPRGSVKVCDFIQSNDCHLKVIQQIVFHKAIAAIWRLVCNKIKPHDLERKEYGSW